MSVLSNCLQTLYRLQQEAVQYHLHTNDHHLHTHTHGVEPELTEATQQTQKGGDRLSALHCRLQQEAEKIRKWKNATEVEIKQKVHSIALRGYNLGLQSSGLLKLPCTQFPKLVICVCLKYTLPSLPPSLLLLQDKTLKDAWQTIDSQRKSLTDLQVRD